METVRSQYHGCGQENWINIDENLMGIPLFLDPAHLEIQCLFNILQKRSYSITSVCNYYPFVILNQGKWLLLSRLLSYFSFCYLKKVYFISRMLLRYKGKVFLHLKSVHTSVPESSGSTKGTIQQLYIVCMSVYCIKVYP